jgi:hypothetical protein
MKNGVSFLALALALSVGSIAQAANYEYTQQYQPNLAQIHVTKALHDAFYQTYIQPYTNNSVTVAILDGMADYTHVDLAGHETVQIVYGGSYTAFADHATHVSGMVGAAQNGIGVVGVDPWATMLSIPVFDDKGWVATDLGEAALNYARDVAHARVANMSYGSTQKGAVFLPGELPLFATYNSQTKGQGVLIVRAAGNDSQNIKPQAFSGNASVDLSNLLLVGSVDSKNKISYFSNKAGSNCIGSCGTNGVNAIKNFFIVAPGQNIASDLPNNSYAYMSGTSMATPQVAGAAALVLQRALNGGASLTPGDVANILKQSADDLGTPGVDSTYGWGLLDVARALNPVGGTYFTTGSKATSGLVSVQSTNVTTSSLMDTNSLQEALSDAIVLDGFGRAFTVNEPKVAQTSSLSLATDFVQDFAGLVSSVTDVATDGETTFSFTSSGDLTHGGFRVFSLDRSNQRFDVGIVASSAFFTTPGAAVTGTAQTFSRTMAEDFYAGSGDVTRNLNQALFAGVDLKTSSRWTVSGLYLRSAPAANLSYVPDNITAVMLARNPLTSSAVKFGANYRFSNALSAGVYSGFLEEQGQTLGMQTGGAFSLGNGETFVGGVSVRAALSDSTTLAAFAEHSNTLRPGAADSLFSATGDWTGSKYGLSLTQANPFGFGGLAQLKLVRPWQIDQGSLKLHVPVGRELDGTIDYQDRFVSLAASTPYEVGVSYLAGSDRFKYGAELTTVGHTFGQQSSTELRLAGAVHWAF